MAQEEWHLLKLQINHCSSTLNSSVSAESIKVYIQKIQNGGKKNPPLLKLEIYYGFDYVIVLNLSNRPHNTYY